MFRSSSIPVLMCRLCGGTGLSAVDAAQGDCECSGCGARLWISVSMIDVVRVVQFTAQRRLDIEGLDQMELQLRRVVDLAMRAEQQPWIVVDLEETGEWTTLDRVCGLFLELSDMMEEGGGRFILCRLRPEILASYVLLGHAESLEIRDDIQAALDVL